MNEDEYLDKMIAQAQQELDEAINLYVQEDVSLTEYLYWRNIGEEWHLSVNVWRFLEK
jgi:hypothetical protein